MLMLFLMEIQILAMDVLVVSYTFLAILHACPDAVRASERVPSICPVGVLFVGSRDRNRTGAGHLPDGSRTKRCWAGLFVLDVERTAGGRFVRPVSYGL
jgi:hypothetical protein